MPRLDVMPRSPLPARSSLLWLCCVVARPLAAASLPVLWSCFGFARSSCCVCWAHTAARCGDRSLLGFWPSHAWLWGQASKEAIALRLARRLPPVLPRPLWLARL